MLHQTSVLLLGTLLGSLFTMVSGLGSSCSAPLDAGDSAPGDPFWMQSITHQGTSAFNSDPSSYQVFRNVKDFGAKGDGVTDDTAAINNAISSGGRCGNANCGSSSTTPAVVFFPAGTYIVSSPIEAFYWTQIIGDAKNPPTIRASANFNGLAVIDADPYIPNGDGAQWYTNQDNFYRSVRNFIIDLTQTSTTSQATGLHWQVSQATSLMNIVVEMSTAAGNNQRGLYMENGSGGFMGDLVFNGGQYGLQVGNQQFTVRNVTVNNANTEIQGIWSWGWTWQRITINNCQVGFDLSIGATSGSPQGVGGEAIIDAVVSNTNTFLQTSTNPVGSLDGSLVLNNIQLSNVQNAVVAGSDVLLAGGTTTINSWAMGNVYSGTNGNGQYTQGNIAAINRPSVLLDNTGRVFGKTHPQYAEFSTDQFVSVKSNGAKGDGQTDDTAAINNVLSQFAGCKIIFFDAGTYIVTSTITVPAGTQIVGEGWTTIMGSGSFFEDYNNPRPVVQVGTAGSTGVVEITDIIFSTRGPAAGAIVVEWNVHDPSGQQGAAGTWDTHIILGGRDGTDLQASNCPTSGSGGNACFAAFMGLHLTSGSSAYLEGLWVWLADHDLDQGSQLAAYSGRGILSESQGPVWMIGTASEHSIEYEYRLVNAANHYMGLIQTETPYFQPSPVPPSPFILNTDFNDPTSWDGAAWALSIENSNNILVFGAGHYSFFENWDTDCQNSKNCQSQIVNVDSASTNIGIYQLTTVDTTMMLSMNNNGVISASNNRNGFSDTVAAWTS
ncbi:glycoside hydrolase family 55 protein [Gelatoporia subvermispora B]|uniref:Glycoside hydrolase family 55 protein n=1 Tax=Ceriporiopsis subvermispora (strain B) TaxID=914234 RepID=M2RGJ4_CERS8|nr:glycoside hydrolase family 55 protein [Gelatoporia subvermispora B]